MKIVFLGTGTSTGVPVIGCKCPVCSSVNPRNKRLRQSLWISEAGYSLLVDATIDLRQQALLYGIDKVDGIAVTHPHADHILGLDETRIFSYRARKPVSVFGSETTLKGIRRNLWYCFEEDVPQGGGLPMLNLVQVDGSFSAGPLNIEVLSGDHGFQQVNGFRIGAFGYLTDCKRVPEETVSSLRGIEVLAINALREAPRHPTHMTVEEAISVIRHISPKRAYLVHLGHEVDYDSLKAKLPPFVEPAYDGLEILL